MLSLQFWQIHFYCADRSQYIFKIKAREREEAIPEVSFNEDDDAVQKEKVRAKKRVATKVDTRLRAKRQKLCSSQKIHARRLLSAYLFVLFLGSESRRFAKL